MNLEPINIGYDAADDPGSFDGAHRELFDLYNRIVWACHHEAAVVPHSDVPHVRELALLP